MGLRVPILEDILQKKNNSLAFALSLVLITNNVLLIKKVHSAFHVWQMVCIKKESKSLKFSSVLM